MLKPDLLNTYMVASVNTRRSALGWLLLYGATKPYEIMSVGTGHSTLIVNAQADQGQE